jgi:hypothetical protein
MATALSKDRPLNVVVPAPGVPGVPPTAGGRRDAVLPAASVGNKKDSVELLLEGIAGPRPGRVRTTPQTGGEASAAYHAEHGLHRGQATHDAEPKVLVERPVTPQSIPLSVTMPRGLPTPSLRSIDATLVTRDDLRRRIVVAFVAGLLVVLGLFVVLRLTSRGAEDATTLLPASSPATPPPPMPGVPEPAAPAVTSMPKGPALAMSAADEPTGSAESASGGAAAAASVAPPRRHRPRSASPAAAPSASAVDLGEFKTKF